MLNVKSGLVVYTVTTGRQSNHIFEFSRCNQFFKTVATLLTNQPSWVLLRLACVNSDNKCTDLSVPAWVLLNLKMLKNSLPQFLTLTASHFFSTLSAVMSDCSLLWQAGVRMWTGCPGGGNTMTQTCESPGQFNLSLLWVLTSTENQQSGPTSASISFIRKISLS